MSIPLLIFSPKHQSSSHLARIFNPIVIALVLSSSLLSFINLGNIKCTAMVGKSFIAKRLPRALLSAGEPLILSSSDVNKEKKESVVDQLFNSVAQNSEKIIPTKPLIKYLKNNPGGVIIFEEYDKICTPALDEVIRGAIDQGIINIDGEKVDCSGTTFIFTSNEDDISMNGFDENSDLSLSKENLEAGYT